MIAEMFKAVSDAIKGLFSSLGEAFTGATNLFWNAEGGTLTTLGILAMVGLGLSLAFLVYRIVRGLISR